MKLINQNIRFDKEYPALIRTLSEELKGQGRAIAVSGLSGGGETAFLCTLAADTDALFHRQICYVLPSETAAKKLVDDLKEDGIAAAFFDGRDPNYYNMSASHESEGRRLSTLWRLLTGECRAVVTTPEALLSPTMPYSMLKLLARRLAYGESCDMDLLCAALSLMGYARVDTVENPGQYARRGGILDVWCAGSAPVRAEFFGDEVDRLGVIDPESQRVTENTDSLDILPCRELIADSDAEKRVRSAIQTCIRKLEKKEKTAVSSDKTEEEKPEKGKSEFTFSVKDALATLRGELSALDGKQPLNFLDKYYRQVYPDGGNLADFLRQLGVICVIRDLSSCRTQLETAEWQHSEEASRLCESGLTETKNLAKAPSFHDLEETASALPCLYVDAFAGSAKGKLAGMYGFRCRSLTGYGERYELFLEELKEYIKNHSRVLVTTDSRQAAETLRDRLSEAGIAASVCEHGGEAEKENRECARGVPLLVVGGPTDGFELFSAHFAVLSLRQGGHSARGSRRFLKKKPRYSPGEKLMSYAELQKGDFVVHAAYGIGRFDGMTQLTVDGVSRDYITIQYAGSDKLFIPADQMGPVSKYIGAHADDGLVKLSKMGGTEWVKSKERAKGAVKSMAKELVKLYAERSRRPGISCPEDGVMQAEFEEAFEYDETEGQLQAASDIKRDLEKSSPMDRLLCGDVGYGKTEVALRAAFQAVAAGYQVAILVPTTILALQHFQTITQRMRGFPVKCEMVSRFRTAGQIEQTLRGVKRGDVDILVGTHRLISQDVEFRNLGLLIVDEEQRFGVAQKEKLKQRYPQVNVLTLSATPIPRTLNMAMSGIRDISILDEAPGERQPVQTYVLEHDDVIVNEAIRRELDRGGQIFYLYNRVETIDRVANRIADQFPDARIAVAHGKSEREDLERIWQGMVEHEIDILVCTTIIETGIDVPNANTLIIENADRMGLSQLHQLRGRVGRSARRAYAYFTYRPNKVLTEIAEKRLSAIREYAEFGAGFRIALRDMELRGAGDLLGAEQHGHLDAIGYDLYIKLLSEAVLEEKGELTQAAKECSVDLKCDAFLPEYYVPSQAQRMEWYRRFAMIATRDDIRDLGDELADRYGEYGRSVDNLMTISLVRHLGQECGIDRITQEGQELRFWQEKFCADRWARIYGDFAGRMRMQRGVKPCICVKIQKDNTPAEEALEVLEKYRDAAAAEPV